MDDVSVLGQLDILGDPYVPSDLQGALKPYCWVVPFLLIWTYIFCRTVTNRLMASAQVIN